MMKKILIIALFACLAASQVVKDCPRDGRAVECETDEAPVCGVFQLGNIYFKETHINHCQACYLGEAHYTVEGKCEDYPADTKFCSPYESQYRQCTKLYKPACGWFNQNVKCKAYPCAITAGNRCEACGIENVLYTTKDECPKPRI